MAPARHAFKERKSAHNGRIITIAAIIEGNELISFSYALKLILVVYLLIVAMVTIFLSLMVWLTIEHKTIEGRMPVTSVHILHLITLI